MSGLETVFGELGTDSLSPTNVKAELKDFSGLERDADVDALYRAAVQRGDLEENFQEVKTTEGIKHPVSVSFAGKVEALPSGFDIRHQMFKHGEIPEHYEVRNGKNEIVGEGAGATATATISQGSVSGITVVTGGSGYRPVPPTMSGAQVIITTGHVVNLKYR